MSPSFELCSLGFLVQWLESERHLHRCLGGKPTADCVHRALRYFQVARGFSGIGDKSSVRRSVLAAFNAVRRRRVQDPVTNVLKLADGFRVRGFKRNVSAASKLLWLAFRAPYLVYDYRAAHALRRVYGHRFSDRDYGAYCSAWRIEYEGCRAQIVRATAVLSQASAVVRGCGLSRNQLEKLARASWFRERVFDKYLWTAGGL